MAGRKKCLDCEILVPVAKRVCNCGYVFRSSQGRKCVNCGRTNIPLKRKTCECNYVFKEKTNKAFQDMPILLTSDRLRTTRHVRMKRTMFGDHEYLYNVSPEHDTLHSIYGQSELYDEDLNDTALESIANTIMSNNSISSDNSKIEKLYPKRARYKATKYSQFNNTTKRNQLSSKNGNAAGEMMATVKEEVISGGSESEELTLKSDDGESEFQSNMRIGESEDEKTLKQVKHDLSEMSSASGTGEVMESKPVKKKGRPRIHPIRPKKPVGRPRKNPILSHSPKHAYIIDRSRGNESNGTGAACIGNINNEMNKWETGKAFKKKGRPKGCKDSKPRKIRNDYLQRLVDRNVDVEGLAKAMQVSKNTKCFLSPPSLISSKRKDKHVLDDAEIEKIEKRLNKTNPFIIPENKKELYSTILGEINRRIGSQLFQSSLQIHES